MPPLIIDKTTEINAPMSKVWDILTKTEYTDQWAKEFTNGAEFHIESDWKMGSPVFWKDASGKTVVEGNVTLLEPGKRLRYTVFDTSHEKPDMTEEDGITYETMEQDGKTTLHILHGDFSSMPEGEKYYRMSEQTWVRVLPKIKELAEK